MKEFMIGIGLSMYIIAIIVAIMVNPILYVCALVAVLVIALVVNELKWRIYGE